MKRYTPWLFVAFVLAILLTLGFPPDRPTRVFLDSPIGRAPCLDLSQVFNPAVTDPAVKPAKFWLHLEARRSRADPNECLPLLSNFSLDHVSLRADDTGPPCIDLCGPPVLVRTAPRLKLQGPPGWKLPPNPRKTGLPRESGFCNV
jgi:hypothetical protein